MSDAPQSLSTLLANVERLLLQDEPDGMLENRHFSVRFGRDAGHLALSILPTVQQTRLTFEFDGSRFVAPKSVYVQRRDGTVTDYKPPQLDPPIQSSESLPSLGDERRAARLWTQLAGRHQAASRQIPGQLVRADYG
jgi:hypothetical protein